MTDKPFKFELKEELTPFTLPYPTISDLTYIFTDNTDNFIDTVYTLCTPEQQQLFDDDFMLLGDLTNSILAYHYQCIADNPRMESFFEATFSQQEEAANKIEDYQERYKKLQDIKTKREQTSPTPKPLMRAVLAHAGESDRKVNFNSWLLRVGTHLNMGITEVSNLPYDRFIEASDQLTVSNDIQICQEVEAEQERKKQEAARERQGR